MFCVVWYYSCSIRKAKKFEQNTLLESYKNEIKILANPGFEQPGPDIHSRPVPINLKTSVNVLDQLFFLEFKFSQKYQPVTYFTGITIKLWTRSSFWNIS